MLYFFTKIITMMPGENHSKLPEIASDATAGICQNCTILHQNLKEYVAALLTLKGKIFDTDRLLTEYQEKCNELQKSQKETSKLHQQLEELLSKMVPLEKQNKEYEAVRAELEEKNNSLKKYQQISEDLDRLKEENTELITLKKNLENQLKKSEESSLKQDHEITQLRAERKRLEKDLKKTQKNLETLELKNIKELKNGSTQTDFPAEPKIDKAKVKLLLEELWTCIEPQPSQTVNPLHLTGTHCESSEYHSNSSKTHLPAPRAKVATKATNSGTPRKRGMRSGELQKSDAFAEEEKQSAEPSGATQCGNRPNIDEILDCFKPLPPLLSPLCATSSPETLFGGLSDSSEDETNEMDLVKMQHNTNLKTSSEEDIDLSPKPIAIQHLDSPTNEPADVSVLASAHRDSLEVSAPCVPQMEVCKSAVNGETNTPPLEIQVCTLEKETTQDADETAMCISDEVQLDGPAGSSSGLCVEESVSNGVSVEMSAPGNIRGFTHVVSDAEDMVVEETPQEETKIDTGYIHCEKALPVVQNKHTADHQDSCATHDSESALEPPLSNPKVDKEDSGLNKHLQTPTGPDHLNGSPSSNSFIQSMESNESEKQSLQSTLNGIADDDTRTEKTMSNVRCALTDGVDEDGEKSNQSEANPTNGLEKQISLSEGNHSVSATVLDSAESTLFSESSSCPNEGIDQAKEQIPDDAISKIQTQVNGILSGMSKDSDANVQCVIKDSSLNELQANNHETEDTKETSPMCSPTSPGKIITNNINDDHARINSYYIEVKPGEQVDTSSAKIPEDEEKINGSISNGPAEMRESSDELESFGLRRKVKTINRVGSQASTENEKVPTKPERDADKAFEGLGTSLEKSPCHSLIKSSDCVTSNGSSEVKLDLPTNGLQSKVSETDLLTQTCTGMSHHENKNFIGHEEPLQETLEECKTSVNQSQKVLEHGCSVSPKLVSDVKEKPTALRVDERPDDSTAVEMTEEEVAGDKPEDATRSSISNDLPTDTRQSTMFRNPAVRSRKRQHSSKEREATPVNLKEEHKSTNLVFANDDISSPTKSPTSIRKVRSEMGPPLPPLLNPLEVTPPRFGRFGTKTVSSQLSFASPVNEETLVQENPVMSPLSDGSDVKSPCLSVPLSCDTKRRRVLPSPLQFCATTPKHAVPVPGRLPPSASSSSSSSPSAPQENSVRILDTMYPDLSARARTLNILRRTVNLNRSDSGITAPDSVGQISRFKAVGSSTVSTKPSEPNEREIRLNQPEENANPSEGSSSTPASQFGKRSGVNIILPKTAKKLRQAGDSPVPPSTDASVLNPEQVSQDPPVQPLPDVTLVKSEEVTQGQSAGIKKEERVGDIPTSTPNPILDALKKIEMSCFDLLPVIKSHVSIGRISKVPVLSDEEKEVIHEFCVVKKLMADNLLPAILVKMKTEKDSLPGTYMQALCRVYIGICRQKEDWERAHLFAYSILKEDFPDAAKLILFMVTTWDNFLSYRSLFCKAMHAVVRMRAQGEVLQYLTAYLGWEKNPPCQTKELITSLVMAMKMGVKMKFLQHDRHGNDLNPPAWEYVYCLDLLCTQEHWKWTHDNIICKNLWPIMNSWVSQSRSVQTPIADVAVATILRLIGRLGQLGMKEKSLDSVRNVAKVINTFGRHGRREGVPWPVQLAAVYAIYDLSPSNPKDALDALAAWREEVTEPVPPAISSCMMQIGSICRHIKS